MNHSANRTPLFRAASAAIALAALSALAPAQKYAMRANLEGAQQVPPNASPAKGTASIVYDKFTNTFELDLTVHGLGSAEVMAHIHGSAPAGGEAGILLNLPLGSKKVVHWGPSGFVVADLLNGLMYIDVHSVDLPGGEIRGQILRDPSLKAMRASLDGFQEVPANALPGTGTMHVSIDTQINQLAYDLTFTNLSSAEVMAHIHGPAPANVNAGIKHALPPGNTKVGVWNYPESDEADILAGLMYVNIHSANLPGGEIRGQFLHLATNVDTYCKAKLTSLGCTPTISGTGAPSASAGSGFAVSTAPVPGTSVGLYFYGKSGHLGAGFPVFQGGYLCMSGAILRTPGQVSGGTTGVCDGAYGIDFNALVAGGSDPTLVAGQLVYLQTWFRDPPASFGSGLSDALKFELLP